QFTLKGKTAYYWCTRWPGTELTLGGIKGKLRAASLLADGRPVAFTQEKDRVILRGLPKNSPDKIAGVTVLKLEFATPPRQVLGAGCVVI
ncbi:MAG TPA: hypothetical protein PLI07_02270, partial [Candidatus Hydrogenedentes bacterium]|nr:hypothetical protein [Candidatus Hydrogenedentota bacterium]